MSTAAEVLAPSSPATTNQGFAPLALPLPVWMLLLAVAIALVAGWTPDQVVVAINRGFGRALGEFALLLLPSFILAGALSSRGMGGAPGFASGMAPFVGAAMVCPDSAYATLSPMAGPRKLETALGTYAGFKLLFPAGPLIVATGLGIAATASLFGWGVLLLGVTWLTGVVLARRAGSGSATAIGIAPKIEWPTLAPFVLLAALWVSGVLAGGSLDRWSLLAFFVTPKGALAAAAACALLQRPSLAREGVVQSALRRTSGLLFTIGAASALGAVLMDVIPFARNWPVGLGPVGAVGTLFMGSALLKMLQGSSMATFAAVTAIGGPLVLASGLSHPAAVYAVCLGTMVAITPNDSFYWLVRTDALQGVREAHAVRLLTLASSLQGLAGLFVLIALLAAGWI